MTNPSEFCELNYSALTALRGQDEPPAMIGVLDGFIDAGRAGHVCVRHLLEQFPATRLATFDADALVVLRERRPVMTYDTTHWDAYRPHELAIDVLEDGSGVPFLLLHGPEPDLRWGAFVESVLHVFEAAGTATFVALYGLPMGVPHTRPVPITVRSSDLSLIPTQTTWLGRMQAPGSAPALIEVRLEQLGRTVVGLTAHVPHYLMAADFPAASQALLTQAERLLDLDLCVERLEKAVEQFDAQVLHEVAASPEIAAMLSQLEAHFDAALIGGSEGEDPLVAPPGEQIIEEFRQYLDAHFPPPPEAEGWEREG